jgi:hypothetical protein
MRKFSITNPKITFFWVLVIRDAWKAEMLSKSECRAVAASHSGRLKTFSKLRKVTCPCSSPSPSRPVPVRT